MSWILQLDTALETAVVSLSRDGSPVIEKFSQSQKDHAAFLHVAIRDLVKEAGITLQQLSAVSIVAGPGSYTGLRVGFAAAKGLCYSLNIPLITIGTLHYMAASALVQLKEIYNYGTMLVCPLIDARRMEVYTGLYNSEMEIKLAPQALILEERFLADWLLTNKVYFFGNGSVKWQAMCSHENACFIEVKNDNFVLSTLTYERFELKIFESVAYTEPVYLKEAHISGT